MTITGSPREMVLVGRSTEIDLQLICTGAQAGMYDGTALLGEGARGAARAVAVASRWRRGRRGGVGVPAAPGRGATRRARSSWRHPAIRTRRIEAGC